MRHLLFVLLLLLAACEPYDGDFRSQHADGVSGQAGLDGEATKRSEATPAPEAVVAEPATPEPVVPEPAEPTKPVAEEAPSEPLGAASKDDSLAALIAEEEAINSATSLGTAGETPEPTPAPRALAGAKEPTPEPETEALGKVDAAPVEGAGPMPGSEKKATAPKPGVAPKAGAAKTDAATAGGAKADASTTEPAPKGAEAGDEAVAAVEPPPLTPGPDALDPCEPDGLTTVAIGALTLHQTFGEGESARALLRGDGGAEYVVGKGSVVGPEGARVVRVSPGEVVLAEIQFDMSGSPVLVQKALRMELPR